MKLQLLLETKIDKRRAGLEKLLVKARRQRAVLRQRFKGLTKLL